MRRPWNGAPFRAFLVGGLMLGAGCGPIEYIAYVPADAAGAIAEAKHLGADKYAPYEITAAEQYIYKARVLAGYARFQSSVAFGRKAGTNARKAKDIAIDKAKLPDVQDTTLTPDAPPPPPAQVRVEEQPKPAPAPAAPPAPAPAPPSKVIIVPAPTENPSK